MKISIGILAWNEEDAIDVALDSLVAQTLFRELHARGDRAEIIVVPNGCTDRTSHVAGQSLETAIAQGRLPGASARVEELVTPGKLEAWNEYVHRLSAPDASVLFLMDADIRIDPPESLWNMLRLLESRPEVLVATDLPRKHVELKRRRSPLDLFSLAVSSMTRAAPGQLTGQLYAIRAPVARTIWMPRGLIVEDGFIKFMVTTEGFTRPQDDSRIARAESAGHIFEAYTRLRDILPNQRRQAVAHTLYRRLRQTLDTRVQPGGASEFLARMHGENPDWFLQHLRDTLPSEGWWLMDNAALSMRLRRLRHLPVPRAIALFPVALAGTLFDLGIALWANSALRRGKIRGLWKDTKSKALAASPDPARDRP